MQSARSRVDRDDFSGVAPARRPACSTVVFLGGQLLRGGRSPRPAIRPRQPAFAFFFLLTAVHGLHLLGGLFVLGATIAPRRGAESSRVDAALRMSVELCTIVLALPAADLARPVRPVVVDLRETLSS